jgi:hypothetical protein
MKCACIFENREEFDSRPPRVVEECGYHACLRRDGDYLNHRVDHNWHVAINRHSEGKMGTGNWPSFMYEAKTIASEVPRLIRLHRDERQGKLPKIHQQCSMSNPVPVQDNRLTCCLGVECRKCPELLALEKAEMTPEQIDVAKAWTCVAHIAMKGGDTMREGYLLTTSDRMYWDNVYESLSDCSTAAREQSE